MNDFSGAGTPLTEQGANACYRSLDLAPAALWSVLAVETSGCGYLPDKRPKILFERHIFSRLTAGRFDVDDPDVSQPSPGGYGASGAHQYDRLAVAIALDPVAALKSASWGLGQIMGENYSAAGFRSVQDMVTAMIASEDQQLAAMAAFLHAGGMDKLLAAGNWSSFARRYNGPNYAANNYDGLLGDNFERYSDGALPDLTVREVQIRLYYRGLLSVRVDGVLGSKTQAAIKAFQKDAGMAQTGAIDAALLTALRN